MGRHPFLDQLSDLFVGPWSQAKLERPRAGRHLVQLFFAEFADPALSVRLGKRRSPAFAQGIHQGFDSAGRGPAAKMLGVERLA
jgi:hypothetical protein